MTKTTVAKDIDNAITLRPSELSMVLESFYKNRKPKPIILGPPGCGKTSVVYQLCEKLKIPVYVFQATLYDPVELKGLPVFDKEQNISRFIRFSDMPSEKEGILFIDDLPHAPTQTQNAFMRIFLEGIAGAWDIGGLFPIGAGNRSVDRAGAKDLQTAMANRFVHLSFQIDHEDWRGWAITHNVAPEVMGFLASFTGREYLNRFDPGKQINATPRSWEMASDCIKSLKGETLRKVLYGTIGDEASTQFLGWLKYYNKMPDINEILKGKDIYPAELDVMFATVTSLVVAAKEKLNTEKGKSNLVPLCQRLIDYSTDFPDRFVELGALLFKDMVKIFGSEALFLCNTDKWMKVYPDLMG